MTDNGIIKEVESVMESLGAVMISNEKKLEAAESKGKINKNTTRS